MRRRGGRGVALLLADPMPITPKRMPFFDHIAEFRRRIVVIAVTIVMVHGALHLGLGDL